MKYLTTTSRTFFILLSSMTLAWGCGENKKSENTQVGISPVAANPAAEDSSQREKDKEADAKRKDDSSKDKAPATTAPSEKAAPSSEGDSVSDPSDVMEATTLKGPDGTDITFDVVESGGNGLDGIPVADEYNDDSANKQRLNEMGIHKKCIDEFSEFANFVMMEPGKGLSEFSGDEVLVVKISGNQNLATVTLTGSVDETIEVEADAEPLRPAIKGVCLMVTGNQTRAELALEKMFVEKLVSYQRGHNSNVLVQVDMFSKIENKKDERNGDNTSFDVKGDGDY